MEDRQDGQPDDPRRHSDDDVLQRKRASERAVRFSFAIRSLAFSPRSKIAPRSDPARLGRRDPLIALAAKLLDGSLPSSSRLHRGRVA